MASKKHREYKQMIKERKSLSFSKDKIVLMKTYSPMKRRIILSLYIKPKVS